jgi:long-chain acyl-CoA synthetase
MIGFYQGNIMKLMDDIAELRPTIFVTVPRLLVRLHDRIVARVNMGSTIKKLLFNFAFNEKTSNLATSGEFSHWLWDRLVFSQLRQLLGGRVRAIISGSAPMSPEVMDFIRICFSCEVYEGYGQTETSAGAAITAWGDWTSGQVGVPAPCNEMKLVDIPEMGYTSADRPNPRGEICIRGPNCFTGYYKAPELTRETLDEEGWVHTGDVGEWDERGRLKVIDRKKNLFKLAQGEYISPDKVENIVTRNRYIAQAFVEGDSLKSSLVAVIVPDFEVLEPWAQSQGLKYSSHAELAAAPEVKQLLLGELKALGREGSNQLKGFEIPREIYVEPEAFSVENDLLTSAFKLKRFQARKYYAEKVAKLYSRIRD